MPFTISEITCDDSPAIQAVAAEFWGGPSIVAHGKLFQMEHLSGFKAVSSGQLSGFLQYEIQADACEILTLVSCCPRLNRSQKIKASTWSIWSRPMTIYTPLVFTSAGATILPLSFQAKLNFPANSNPPSR